MKKLLRFLLIACVFALAYTSNAQQDDNNYFQLSPRIGYDLPSYNNNTPYADYKGGLDLGLSLDYYWDWFGLGFDLDYIKNQPESTYPTTNLYDATSSLITSFNLTEDNITRLFYGIGPNIQFRSQSRKFTTEFNTRIGLASIKGGRTYLESAAPTIQVLNFHAGYDVSSVLTFKGQVRFTYFLNDKLGVNLGAYYMHHFGAEELFDVPMDVATGYYPIADITTPSGSVVQGVEIDPALREAPCDCDISSIGLFAGITYKFNKNEKDDDCKDCGVDVTVTARDKYTNEVLPFTDVVLEDLDGNIVQSGTTNAYGTVVFNDVEPDNLLVKGKLNEIDLEDTTILKNEFKASKKSNESIQKAIIYSDLNFILIGEVVECNTDKGIQGVEITLRDTSIPGQKSTLSDGMGDFVFHLKQASTFLLNGNKDGYFSNEVSITTNDYDRNKSLFIDFEMCVNPCGQAIKLDNIIFNLAKWDILPKARPDLNSVVALMQTYPTIKVEMSSHTDSRGGDDFNQELSQKRAQSTVNYLVNAGIERNRLIAKGAGESELLNRCADGVQCAESEHTINRRTEFKIVCTN